MWMIFSRGLASFAWCRLSKRYGYCAENSAQMLANVPCRSSCSIMTCQGQGTPFSNHSWEKPWKTTAQNQSDSQMSKCTATSHNLYYLFANVPSNTFTKEIKRANHQLIEGSDRDAMICMWMSWNQWKNESFIGRSVIVHKQYIKHCATSVSGLLRLLLVWTKIPPLGSPSPQH